MTIQYGLKLSTPVDSHINPLLSKEKQDLNKSFSDSEQNKIEKNNKNLNLQVVCLK
ncbi:MAG: hypothetical protein N4J56_007990 [Chroococcidiopsis sp. SAG 2025]|nr:hypothetical protein [Chroococcidiopsis sp. SAG 2025]